MAQTITIGGEHDLERASLRWDIIKNTFTPETETLSKRDRDYFEGVISFLIGKDIKLSNLKPHHYEFFYIFAEYILTLTWFPMLVPHEFINKEIAEYLNKLGLTLSENAMGFLYGPMSYSHQTVKQEVVGVPTGPGGD